ncbi:MAG: Na/Pi cotransporter family protein [Thermoguttaceae bacterium]|nr:Na/Pi cotransporter family protein [Thermoguttaceae bacterium]
MSIPEGQHKRPRPTLKTVALLALLAFLGTTATSSLAVRADDQNVAPTPEVDAADAVSTETTDAAETADQHKNIVQKKWLPDLKVLVGAPTTTLDISATLAEFCEQDVFKTNGATKPEDLTLELVSDGGGSVAKATLDGTTLFVDWTPDAIGDAEITLKATPKDDPSKVAVVSFEAESWTPDYWTICATVLGGLGLFLIGMKRMSDGLQAVAGARLRRIISMFTNNRFLAVGVGFMATVLVQSSSATTVMILGFVNSGLMTLAQAVGCVMGTNIGTTTTGWLLTLNLGAYGLPLIGVAGFVYLLTNNEKICNLAACALGIGLIFFGLKTMGAALAPLPDIPAFGEFMQSFQADSLWGAIKCVMVGCVTTMIVQSSAATIGITMTLATLGAIDFTAAAALVLGENIGTTITALLASIGATTNARRVAYFHTLFNCIGICWALAIFFPILLPGVNALGDRWGLDDVGKIALTHSLFNVTNTIVFLPFVGAAAAFLTKIASDRASKPKKRVSTTGLASFMNDDPIVGIERSRLEIQRMFGDCQTLARDLKTLKSENFENETLVEESFALEKTLDDRQDETIDFISSLTTRAFTVDVAVSAREQVRLAEELETISDYFVGVLKSNLKLRELELPTPKEIDDSFVELLGYATESLEWIGKIFAEWGSRDKLLEEMTERRVRYVARVKEIREQFLHSMFEERLDPQAVVAVDYQLNAWRRVYEHLHNIAEAMEPRRVPAAKPAAV